MRLAPFFALLALGCGDDALSHSPTGVSARVSDSIATVVNVHWSTPTPTTGYVEFGPTRELGQTTSLETTSTTAHSMTLLGLVPSTLYYYRVVTWDGADAGASDIVNVRTGALPAGLPVLTASGDSTSTNGFTRFTLAPIINQGAATVAIFASNGSIVWYHAEPRTADVTRARFSRDGKSVLYNARLADPTKSEIVRVALDGTSTTSVVVPTLGKDFVELADGTLAALADDPATAATTNHGDTIVEVSPGGASKTVFAVSNCFTVTDFANNLVVASDATALSFDGGSSSDSADDSYYISLRNLSTIAKVNRSDGQCSQTIGRTRPTIAFASGTAAFALPGGFDPRGTSLFVVDTGGGGSDARLVSYTIDTTTSMAIQAALYSPMPPVQVTALGSTTALVGNLHFIDWSTAGLVELADNDGKRIWSVQAAAGATFGMHDLSDASSLYLAPKTTP